MAWGQFAELIACKAAWADRRYIAVNPAHTSQDCSGCGNRKEELTLADRVFRCQNPRCRQVMDRDLNAAINLHKLAGSSPESLNACGEESAGQRRKALVNLSPVKQEPDAFDASVSNGKFWRTVSHLHLS